MKIELDMYQTLAIAVLVLMLGAFLKKRIIFWRNSAFRLRSSADCFLQFSLASATVPDWQNFLLMTLCGRSAWYFSLHRSAFRRI